MSDWVATAPEHWTITTIGAATDTKLGRMLNAEARSGPHRVPYLRNENVRWGGFDLTDVYTMSIPPEKQPDYELKPGDVLVCEGGDIGRAAVWTGSDEPMYFQKALHRIRAGNALEPQYLRYWLEHLALANRLLPYATGSTILHLPQQSLRRLPLAVPPREEQRAIVEAIERSLSLCAAASAELERGVQRLGVLDDALSHAAVTGRIAGFQGGGNGLWDTPTAWQWREVGGVAEVRGGIQKTPARKPVDNTAPFLRVANVQRNELVLDDVHEVELAPGELDRHRLEEGDLLVVEGNGSLQHIGRCAVWDGSIRDCVHQNHLIRVRPGPDITYEWLNLVWNSPTCAEQVRRVAQTTSGLYTLSTKKVASVQLPVPPLDVQQTLTENYKARSTQVRHLDQTIAAAQHRTPALRRSILKAAFEGRLTSDARDAQSFDDLQEATA